MRMTVFTIFRVVRPALNRPYNFKFFQGCLPEVLLGPFLKNVSHLLLVLLLFLKSHHIIF